MGDARLMWLGVVVLLSGVAQLLSAAAATQSAGWGIAWPRNAHSRECDDIFRGMWPVVIGMSITQLNAVVDSLLAWWLSLEGTGWGIFPRLPEGSASALYFGQRLQQFPLGIIGVSLGTVLFPRLSRHVAGGELAAVRDDLGWGLRFTIAVCLPASVGLMILATPITEVLFQRGEFDAQDVLLTSRMVAAYGFSVWASVALLVIHRGFYSLGDRVTPLRLSLWMMFANLLLNLLFVKLFLGVGFAWATTVTTIAHTGLAIRLLEARTGRINWPPVLRVFGKTLIGIAGMWAVCELVGWIWPATESSLVSAARLAVVVVAGGGAYFALTKALRLTEATSLFRVQEPR
jgi:putative peptidoglycan lipid II flippase